MLEKFKQKYSFSQTPALLVFEKGKCVSSVEWGKDGLPKFNFRYLLLSKTVSFKIVIENFFFVLIWL